MAYKYKLNEMSKTASPEAAEKATGIPQSKQEVGKVTFSKDGDTKYTVTDVNPETGQVSWKVETLPAFDKLLDDAHEINRNNFGFDHINIFENPQYTEYYGGGGHYSWHPDSEINGQNNGIIRKISLTIQLNNPSEYEGGKFELLTEGRDVPLQKGDAVFFASFLVHRVTPVIRGTRQSLVQWFTGTPFR